MKKLTALILALALCAFASALAEQPAIPTTDLGELPIAYAENWVELENGTTICVPPEWTPMDVVALLGENSGVLYMAAGAAGESLTLVYVPDSGMTDVSLLAPVFVAAYPDTAIVKLNGANLVQYSDEANAYFTLCTLDESGGMYLLIATPIPAEESVISLQTMLASLKPVEPAQ